jgi:hypothetical protein
MASESDGTAPEKLVEQEQEPSFKSFFRSIYEDYFKKWIDFRDYLRQRRLILTNPEVIANPALHDKNWRKSLAFAVQGTLFVSLLVSGLNQGFRLTFMATHHGLEVEGAAEEQLKVAKLQLENLRKSPDKPAEGAVFVEDDNYYELTTGTTREGFIKRLELSIPELERDVVIEKKSDDALTFLEAFIVSAPLFFAAFVFSRLILREKDREYLCDAKTAYLYLVTAHNLWNVVFSTVLIVVLIDLAKYWPEVLGGGLIPIFLVLVAVGNVISIATLDRAATGMRDLGYDLYYGQMMMKVSVAQTCAFVCCWTLATILVFGYVQIYLFIDTLIKGKAS